jgi:hypothetical protein
MSAKMSALTPFWHWRKAFCLIKQAKTTNIHFYARTEIPVLVK